MLSYRLAWTRLDERPLRDCTTRAFLCEFAVPKHVLAAQKMADSAVYGGGSNL